LPPVVASVTVTLTTIASAEEGTPQRPVIWNDRLVFAASAGEPQGPAGPLVSTTRQGATV
jgi:hypothetical protein